MKWLRQLFCYHYFEQCGESADKDGKLNGKQKMFQCVVCGKHKTIDYTKRRLVFIWWREWQGIFYWATPSYKCLTIGCLEINLVLPQRFPDENE